MTLAFIIRYAIPYCKEELSSSHLSTLCELLVDPSLYILIRKLMITSLVATPMKTEYSIHCPWAVHLTLSIVRSDMCIYPIVHFLLGFH